MFVIDSLIFLLGNGAVGKVIYDRPLSDVNEVEYNGSKGWQSYTYTFASPGSGSINFGVYNAGDAEFPSELYIDNVKNAPVPIPAAIWLFGAGLMGIVGIRRRFQR